MAKRAFQLATAAVVAAPLAFSAASALHAQEPAKAPAPTTTVSATQPEIRSNEPSDISYLFPLLLAAGAGLPLLWWLMRTQQPPPQKLPSSLTRLIAKLQPTEDTPEQTPLWQLYLRVGIAATAIVAMSGPLLHPQPPLTGDGPLMLVVDNGWASAPHWEDRVKTMNNLIDQAEREGRQVIVLPTAQPGDNSQVRTDGLVSAAEARRIISGLQPMAWPSDREATLKALSGLSLEKQAAIYWLSNGLENDGTLALVQQLENFGSLTVMEDGAKDTAYLLSPKSRDGDTVSVNVTRANAEEATKIDVVAKGSDGRIIARTEVDFAAGAKEQTAVFDLPSEIRNQISQISIAGNKSAGSVLLMDERWRRRPVGMVTDNSTQAQQPLLDEFHYIRQAMNPYVDLRQGDVGALLKGGLSVLVLGDSSLLNTKQRAEVNDWIKQGGTVLRFAGPHLAQKSDELVPVELRHQDGSSARRLGGAMSWSKPEHLAPFDKNSPFADLAVPNDITVKAQVLAEPNLNPNTEVWARLEDGTPLVSAEKRGKGWMILVHTTASADWSNLPMSELFIDMLRKVVAHSNGVNNNAENNMTLPPYKMLDGSGKLSAPLAGAKPLTPDVVKQGVISPQYPPGLFGSDSAMRAHNLGDVIQNIDSLPDSLPGDVTRKSYASTRETDLTGPLVALAVLLAMLDQMAAMGQRGQLPSTGRKKKSGDDAPKVPAADKPKPAFS